MKKSNKIIIICIVMLLFLNFGDLVATFFMTQLIDKPAFDYVIKLASVWILSLFLLQIKNYILQRYYLKERDNNMKSLLKILFSFPFSVLESKKYNDDLERAREKTSQEQAFISSVESITTAIFNIIGLYILLFQHVSLLVLIVLSTVLFLVILILCVVNGRLSKLMYNYWKSYIKNTRKYNYISEVLTSKEFVEEKKVFDYVSFFLEEFDKEFNYASKKNRLLGRKRIELELTTELIFLFYSLFAFLLLFYCYLKNQITIGLFVTVTGYMLTLLKHISFAVGAIETISKYKIFSEDYFSFVNQVTSSDSAKCMHNLHNNIMIEIKHLQFRYPNSEKLILNDITFCFQKGKKYAIVGINGSGKTTLAKLLSRLYVPSEGDIVSKSEPVVLFQDFNRYPLTLKENITLSKTFGFYDHKRVIDIEQKAGLSERIEKMKLGHYTELTTLKEEGEELSGGEWQRIALARVLWRNADIYILDEPTASLDPLEEIRVFKLYNELLKDKTVIYITHRLGFVKNVDEIIVLNDGKIVEVGSHSSLISRPQSIYKNMFEEQRKWYE